MKQRQIGVFVRVRPYQDKQPPTTFILSMNEQQITVKDKEKEQDLSFAFDQILQIKSDQKEVFNKIGQPIVDAAFEGINGTMFAYGQTSSGKTYTCVGPDCQDPEDKGLLPRSVQSIFERISESPNYIEFRIKVSMIEIYMEKIKDLLDTSKNDLRLRQNKSKGIYIQDVTQEYVSSTDEAMKVFKRGVSNRSVAFTSMNDASSRSHMAFILTLYQNNLKDGSAKSGKITVVDLAGSEKVSKTMAEGKVLDEAKQINKSLSSLGNVINALTDAKISHIPYRDSKLTRLLQQSLGGNSLTSLIINISPSSYNASESISSLRFGFRAKQIKNKPKINKQYTIAELLVLLQKSEKRNQELEVLLKELTATARFKKRSSKDSVIIQNLLDSDNPLSALQDNTQIQEKPLTVNRSAIKTIRKCFESEAGQEDESQTQSKGKTDNQQSDKQKQRSQNQQRLLNSLKEKEEELQIVSEQLVRVSGERVDLMRQLDICKQRLDCVMKEAKLNILKLNSQKRESQSIMEKYIKQTLVNQDQQHKCQHLQSKIVGFQQKLVRLSHLHQQIIKKSNIFGLDNDLHQQTSKILQQALEDTQQKQQMRMQMQDRAMQQQRVEQLNLKVKNLEQQVSMYRHLEQAKEELIKQKLKFMQQRDRIYKDLQNRIEKVLELQERLDQQKQKTIYLSNIITLDDDERTRKIRFLQQQIDQISENYYVLKGQQSSWIKTNRKVQQKIQEQNRKIMNLQGYNIELRAQVDNLKTKCEELQVLNQNDSVLDIELDQNQNQMGRGNIVKVVRSYISQINT